MVVGQITRDIKVVRVKVRGLKINLEQILPNQSSESTKTQINNTNSI